MSKNLSNAAINLIRIAKKFRDGMKGFTREIVINAAKSLNNRMKIKGKQEKKEIKHPLFSILNQLVYAVRHYCDQYIVIVS